MTENVKHPVIEEEIYNPWSEYDGPTEWGTTFIVEWPAEHPDANCSTGKTPNEDGECIGCGWMPAGESRRKADDQLLRTKIHFFPGKPKPLILAAYLGYCEKFVSKEIAGSPDLFAVAEWFNEELTKDEQDVILEKHLQVPDDVSDPNVCFALDCYVCWDCWDPYPSSPFNPASFSQSFSDPDLVVGGLMELSEFLELLVSAMEEVGEELS